MSNTFYKVKQNYKFSHILYCLVENRLLSLMIFFLFSDFRHLFCIHIAMWCECPESQVGLQWLTRQQLTVCVPVHSGQESELSLCYRLFCTSFYILTAMSMLSENLRYLYECSELCDSFHVKNSLQYLPIETVGSDQVSNSTCSLGFIWKLSFCPIYNFTLCAMPFEYGTCMLVQYFSFYKYHIDKSKKML